jgi:hypothetical protein
VFCHGGLDPPSPFVRYNSAPKRFSRKKSGKKSRLGNFINFAPKFVIIKEENMKKEISDEYKDTCQ